MQIILVRRESKGGATIGNLQVWKGATPVYSCVTLEDQLREIPGKPVAEWKVPGKTAIPAGTYRVMVTLSARFACALPLLLNVPGFSGIRIHKGNTAQNTEGCLLPGKEVGPDGVSVLRSREAFEELFTLILEALNAGQHITITVDNPPNYTPAAAAA